MVAVSPIEKASSKDGPASHHPLEGSITPQLSGCQTAAARKVRVLGIVSSR